MIKQYIYSRSLPHGKTTTTSDPPSNERSISRASLPQLEVIIDAIVMALQLKLVKPGRINHSLSLALSYLLFKKLSEVADYINTLITTCRKPLSCPLTFLFHRPDAYLVLRGQSDDPLAEQVVLVTLGV